MLNSKENKKIIDNYDYLANAVSSMDCTGLIPALPTSEEELDAYNEVYRYQTPATRVESDSRVPDSE